MKIFYNRRRNFWVALYVVFFLVIAVAQCFGQSLSGRVLSRKDSAAIPFATVYIPNTTEGAITDENGSFRFQYTRIGRFELAASHASYKASSMIIDPEEKSSGLIMLLDEKSIELNEIVVKPNPEEWKINFEVFKKSFFSNTENAAKCKIINADALQFNYDINKNAMEAWAFEPLLIENKALGYMLHYDLDDFYADFNKNMISYKGNLFFKEMKKGGRKIPMRWIKAREAAYKGSVQHFFTSVYKNNLVNEGFIVSKLKRIPNPDKPDDSYIKAKQLEFMNSEYVDSLIYYNSLSKLPDQIGLVTADSISGNDIAFPVPNSEKKRLQEEFLLLIRYYGEKESQLYTNGFFLTSPRLPYDYQESIIQIPIRETYIYPSGYVDEQNNLIIEGYMGWEKFAEILPLNYKVSEEQSPQ